MKKFLNMPVLTMFFVLTVGFSFAAGTWVAKIDGKTVSSTDLDKILEDQQLLAEITTGRNVNFGTANKKFQKQILENQIMQQLMVNEIKSVNKDKKFTSESEIAKQKASLSTILERSLWIKAYSDKVLRPQITVSKQAIEKFYNENKDQFKNVSKDQASDFIKEELTLQQIQPLIMSLQAKIKTEASVNINEKYFG